MNYVAAQWLRLWVSDLKGWALWSGPIVLSQRRNFNPCCLPVSESRHADGYKWQIIEVHQQHCHGPTQGRGRKNTVSCFHDTEITVWAFMALCTLTLSKMEQSETYPFRCQAGSTNIEECCFRFSCYSFRLKIKMNKSTMWIYHNVDFQCGCGT